MSVFNLIYKTIIVVFFTFFIDISLAQPVSPPFAFEDSYEGKADYVAKYGKVKIKKTYYKLGNGSQPSTLYHIFEFNKSGFLVNQKWYNLLSKKEMYSAYYTYNSDNFIISCVEKITNEIDAYNYHSRQLANNGYFLVNSTGDDWAGQIPMDKDSNLVIKTLYSKNPLGGYIAKKYFYDGSFYKEKISPTVEYGPELYENLYINQDKSIEYVYSNSFYKADTLYQSADTLNISIKTKRANLECFRILKIRNNNRFIITDIDRVLVKMRLHFSYRNSFIDSNGLLRREINSITYLNYNAVDVRLLLVHKFEDLDNSQQSQLNNRIELTEINNQDFFERAQSCLYYTKFKDGDLFSEEQYSIGVDKIRKLRDIKFTHHNLVSEKICYNACFGLISLSKALDYDNIDSLEEINVYEYFD